jgi:hypothetical protein
MNSHDLPYENSLPSDDLVRLKEAATRFRLAIERCDPKHLGIAMQGFPKGSCGAAGPLLGTYLAEQGLGRFTYVLGRRDSDGINGHHYHAWLEADGIIVDITADQFPEIDQKVIVTTQSDWHATFEREEAKDPADYRIYEECPIAKLGETYRAILTKMEGSCGPN